MASDYILRMIEQVAMMIAAIIARRQRGDLAGAAGEIEEKCLQHIGLPLAVIRQSTPEAVAELLAAGGGLRHPRSILLAELLIQDAGISELRGDPPFAAIAYAHAARLLADSLPVLSGDDLAHYEGRLAEVNAKLRDIGDGTFEAPEQMTGRDPYSS